MNKTELRDRLRYESKRSDLDFDAAILDATELLERRLSIALTPLVADQDTNEILSGRPLLYIYAGMRSISLSLEDGEAANFYGGLLVEACNQTYVTDTSANGLGYTDPEVGAPTMTGSLIWD